MQFNMSSYSNYYTIRVLTLTVSYKSFISALKHLSCIYMSNYGKNKRKTAQNNTNRVF